MRSRRFICLIASALLACASALRAQSRIWRPEDRVTISSFNDVSALAYDGRHVFAVSANGVEIYDEAMRRWLEPSTIEDGFPNFTRVTSALYDRAAAGLWLQTDAGTFFLSDLSQRWESRPFDRGAVSAIDPARLPQNDPSWRIVSSTATIDATGRRWPITSVVPAERPGTYWVGTAGGNIFFADTRNLSSEFQVYGMLSRGAASIAIGKDGGVWLGGDGLGPRNGVVRADADLQKWTWYESYAARAPRNAVTRMLVAGDTTWAATPDGLYEFDSHARSWRFIGEGGGRGSVNITSLAQTRFGIWAGTTHGLAVIDPSTLQSKWSGMSAARVAGVAARGDELWAASDAGLFVAVVDSTGVTLRQPHAAETDPALRGLVDDVAVWRDSVFVIANRSLYVLDPAGGEAIVREAALAAVGRMYRLRADTKNLFVIGTQGVARRNEAGEWSYLTIPGDIPAAPIYDVAAAGDDVWVATPAGATRLHWK